MTTESEQAKAIAHRFHVEVWEKHNLEILKELVHPDFQPTTDNASKGSEAARDFLETLFAAFPDLNSTQEDLIGEGNKAVLRWTIRATHTGTLWGMPPTGKKIEIAGMDILEIQDGKIAKDYGGIGDQMPKLMEQLKG